MSDSAFAEMVVAMEVLDIILTAADLARGGNELLAAMQEIDLRELARSARRVSYTMHDTLIEANAPTQSAYFIESGVASVTTTMGAHQTDISLVGPEGMIGTMSTLAGRGIPFVTVVQTDELRAVRVEAGAMKALSGKSESFRGVLAGATHRLMVQIAENLVSNTWQPTIARLARWLLLYADRVRSSRLSVTHAFLAERVGAQRPRITAALHALEGDGAISAKRGCIVIRDEAALRSAASQE